MRYDINRDAIELSVEELCMSALMGGSIDNRHASRRFHERAADRSHIYEKLHLSFGMRYYDRVELTNTCKIDGVFFTVTGYADGVLCHDAGYTVDEVRIGSSDKRYSAEEEQYHQIRLAIYAYFLCCAKEREEIETRQVFFDAESSEIQVRKNRSTKEELKTVYSSVLSPEMTSLTKLPSYLSPFE